MTKFPRTSSWRTLLAAALAAASVVACTSRMGSGAKSANHRCDTSDPDCAVPVAEFGGESSLALRILDDTLFYADDGRSADIKWESMGEGFTYSMIVAHDVKCAEPVLKLSALATTNQRISVYEPGAYFLCIFAETTDGQLIPATNNGLSLLFGGDGASGSSDDPRLTVAPAKLEMRAGDPRRLVALIAGGDHRNSDVGDLATWQSSDPSVVQVGNAAGEKGVVRGLQAGSAVVTVGIEGLAASVAVTVLPPELIAIELSPASFDFPQGLVKPLTATGVYSDGSVADLTSLAAWTTDHSSVAQIVGGPGLKGVAAGTTRVVATYGGRSAAANVTISFETLASIEIAPAALTMPKGLARTLTATAIFGDGSVQDVTAVGTWTSINPSVVSFQGAPGELLAKGVGTTKVRIVHSGKTAELNVAVTAATLDSIVLSPATVAVPLGLSQNFRAVGVYSDGTVNDLTASVAWSAGAPAVAQSIPSSGAEGAFRGASLGAATITATLGAVSGTAAMTVTAAELASITIAPLDGAAPLGAGPDFTAMGQFTDGTSRDITDEVTWSSSDGGVLTVSNGVGSHGVTTEVAPGSTIVTAASGDVVANTSYNVMTSALLSLTVTPTTPTVAAGLDRAFTASGHYSNGAVVDLTSVVTWSSSAPGVATVSNSPATRGLATAVAAGTSTVTAAFSGLTGTTTLSVSAALPVSIVLTPPNIVVTKAANLQLTATATMSDGSVADITGVGSWSSRNAAFAAVSDTAGTKGLVTGVEVGNVTIDFEFGGLTVSRALTVNPVCGGKVVAGYCWYTSLSSQSCQDACASRGGYDSATRFYAGSDGTNENCARVIDALNSTTGTLATENSGTDALGCHTYKGATRSFGASTTAEAVGAVTRACACGH